MDEWIRFRAIQDGTITVSCRTCGVPMTYDYWYEVIGNCYSCEYLGPQDVEDPV